MQFGCLRSIRQYLRDVRNNSVRLLVFGMDFCCATKRGRNFSAVAIAAKWSMSRSLATVYKRY